MKTYPLRMILLFLLSGVVMSLRGETQFYDNKSWIVNCAGDYEWLSNIGFATKVNGINIPIRQKLSIDISQSSCRQIAANMTNDSIGTSMIRALTHFGMDDKLLRKLALDNANKQDIEFGLENIRANNHDELVTLLADDYEPILCHNYIVLTHKELGYKKKEMVYYAIFRVEVSKEEAFDIVANIGNPAVLRRMKFPVKFLYSGVCGDKPEKTVQLISENVPDLAVRGVILKRNPAVISMGQECGLKKGDLVSVYSQRLDKDGIPYSKRISRARVGAVGHGKSQVNFEAKTAGNRKNGDIVVRTPDSKLRFGILATYQPHLWGADAILDTKVGFTKSGLIHHFLVDLGFAMTDKPGASFCVNESDYFGKSYKSPMFFDFGIGYGISKTFLGFVDVMPYVLVQFEFSLMEFDKKLYGGTASTDNKASIGNLGCRGPIGLRLSFNLSYPIKLVLEGGYAFHATNRICREICEIIGAKRGGYFVNCGLIF